MDFLYRDEESHCHFRGKLHSYPCYQGVAPCLGRRYWDGVGRGVAENHHPRRLRHRSSVHQACLAVVIVVVRCEDRNHASEMNYINRLWIYRIVQHVTAHVRFDIGICHSLLNAIDVRRRYQIDTRYFFFI